MSTIGELALWAALLLAAWGIAAGGMAARGHAAFAESARRAVIAQALLLALAVAGVLALLLAPDFSYAFAAGSTSANLPAPFRLAALLSRLSGDLLLFAFLTSALGAFAMRAAAGAPRLALAVSTFVAATSLGLIVGANPYARAAMTLNEGAGLDPAWQLPWTPIARAALVLYAAVLAVTAACALARCEWRRWVRLAMALSAVTMVFALRRSLTGPDWGAVESIVFVLVLPLQFSLIRGRPRRRAGWLGWAGIACTMLAFSGEHVWNAATKQTVSLRDGTPAEARGRLGSSWTFTSDGLSNYQELNRHVIAVLVDVRKGAGPARRARAEWRYYEDANGSALGDGSPVGVVLAGPLEYVVLGFALPPAGEDVVLNVRFIPFFGLFWVALLLWIAITVRDARAESRP